MKARLNIIKALFYAVVILVLLVLAGVLTMYLLYPKGPVDYMLENPESLIERNALVEKLQSDLVSIQASGSEEWQNDADYIWPKDRTLIVLAIEKYFMNHKSLPTSLNDLTSGTETLLQPTKLSQNYTYRKTSEGWEIRTTANYPVAIGN
jgi:hypothetical protein